MCGAIKRANQVLAFVIDEVQHELGLYMMPSARRLWGRVFRKLAVRVFQLGHVVHCEFELPVEAAIAQRMHEMIESYA